MSKRCLTALIALVTMSANPTMFGAWSVDSPTAGEIYVKTSNIAANGEKDNNVNCRVRMRTGSVTGPIMAESAIITMPGTQWQHGFVAPQGGWTVTADNFCVLYDPLDNRKDDNQWEAVN